ncbi:unnamed protein product, partial [Symbiodinium sp. CCMP2592]
APAPPTAAKLTGTPLAQLVGLQEGDPDISSETRLVLRCTLGELAVHGGVDEPWVRQALVSALSDFDSLQPSDPTLRPFVFRALTALAGVTNQNGDAITAEGLYRTALDHVEKYKTSGQRAETWRSWVSEGFVQMLAEGRHAEQRKAEIQALQAEVKHSSTSVRRWVYSAATMLPPTETPDVQASSDGGFSLMGTECPRKAAEFAGKVQKTLYCTAGEKGPWHNFCVGFVFSSAQEGSHVVKNLHRDWMETRLVDTCIAGCVGRKST